VKLTKFSYSYSNKPPSHLTSAFSHLDAPVPVYAYCQWQHVARAASLWALSFQCISHDTRNWSGPIFTYNEKYNQNCNQNYVTTRTTGLSTWSATPGYRCLCELQHAGFYTHTLHTPYLLVHSSAFAFPFVFPLPTPPRPLNAIFAWINYPRSLFCIRVFQNLFFSFILDFKAKAKTCILYEIYTLLSRLTWPVKFYGKSLEFNCAFHFDRLSFSGGSQLNTIEW